MGLYSIDTRSNVAFKLGLNFAHTLNSRDFTDEPYGSAFVIASQNIWGETIDSTPATAFASGIVSDALSLTVTQVPGVSTSYICTIPTVPASLVGKVNPLTGSVYQDGDRVGHIIPQFFGLGYKVVLKDGSNVISEGDTSAWFLDPFSGVVTQENGTVTPTTLECRVYTGKLLTDRIDSLETELGDAIISGGGVPFSEITRLDLEDIRLDTLIGDISGQVDALGTPIDVTLSQLVAVSGYLDGRIDDTDVRVTTNEGDILTLQSDISSLAVSGGTVLPSQLDDLQTQITTLSGELDLHVASNDNSFSALNTQIDGFSLDVDESNARIDLNEIDISAILVTTDNITGSVQQNTLDIDDLQLQLDAAVISGGSVSLTDFSNLSGRVDDNDTDILTLSASIVANDGEILAQQQLTTILTDTIGALNAGLQDNGADIIQLRDDIVSVSGASDQRLDLLEINVVSLSASVGQNTLSITSKLDTSVFSALSGNGTVESLTTTETNTFLVLSPDGTTGVEWVSISGGVTDLSNYSTTSEIAGLTGNLQTQIDNVSGGSGSLPANNLTEDEIGRGLIVDGGLFRVNVDDVTVETPDISGAEIFVSGDAFLDVVCTSGNLPVVYNGNNISGSGFLNDKPVYVKSSQDNSIGGWEPGSVVDIEWLHDSNTDFYASLIFIRDNPETCPLAVWSTVRGDCYTILFVNGSVVARYNYDDGNSGTLGLPVVVIGDDDVFRVNVNEFGGITLYQNGSVVLSNANTFNITLSEEPHNTLFSFGAIAPGKTDNVNLRNISYKKNRSARLRIKDGGVTEDKLEISLLAKISSALQSSDITQIESDIVELRTDTDTISGDLDSHEADLSVHYTTESINISASQIIDLPTTNVENITTTETNGAFVLKPDGVGGVTWATDISGSGGGAINNVLDDGTGVVLGDIVNNSASGLNAVAEGINTTATGAGSHAEGVATVSLSGGSHAEGYNTEATTLGSHAEGYSESKGNIRAGGITKLGLGAHAEGFAEGTSSIHADGKGAHAEGYAYTNQNVLASGNGSHAEGLGTTATGGYSHAEGWSTVATAYGSHAEGYKTTASGSYSHAEGDNTVASNISSHAEGRDTTSTARGSHAEGNYTTASGFYSHAEGNYTTASGDESHAGGNRAKAIHDNSKVWSDGTSFESRGIKTYNVHATNGMFISGGITVGSPTGGNQGVNSVNAEEIYVNGVLVGASTIENITTTETNGELVLKPDGVGGVTWTTDISGSGGTDLSNYSTTSEIAGLTGNLQDQIDNISGGSGSLPANNLTEDNIGNGLVFDNDLFRLNVDDITVESIDITGAEIFVSGDAFLDVVCTSGNLPVVYDGNNISGSGIDADIPIYIKSSQDNNVFGWEPGANVEIEWIHDDNSNFSISLVFTRNISEMCSMPLNTSPVLEDRLHIKFANSFFAGKVLRYGYNASSGGEAGIPFVPIDDKDVFKVKIDIDGALSLFRNSAEVLNTTNTVNFALSDDQHTISFIVNGGRDDVGLTNITYLKDRTRKLRIKDGGVTEEKLEASLLAKINNAPQSSDIVNIESDILTISGNLDAQQDQITSNDGDITGLRTDVDTISGNFVIHIHTKSNITDFVESEYVHVTGNETIAGNKIFSDNVEIGGTLTVAGSATVLNTETLLVEDNLIVLNSSLSGTPPTFLESGVQINRGDESDYFFNFREEDNAFVIGMSGDKQAVATREDVPNTNAVAYWNSVENRFDTVSNVIISGGEMFIGGNVISTTLTQLTTLTVEISGVSNIEVDSLLGYDANQTYLRVRLSGIITNDTTITLPTVTSTNRKIMIKDSAGNGLSVPDYTLKVIPKSGENIDSSDGILINEFELEQDYESVTFFSELSNVKWEV